MNKKITILFFVALFLWACYETEVSFKSLINGFADVNFFISEMFPPDFSEVSKVFPDFITTLKMAFVSTFYGAFLAYPIAILAANTVTKTKFLNVFFRVFLNLVRTIPDLLLAALCVALFGANPFAGIIALSFFSFGIISKLLYESLESLDENSLDPIRAVGGSWLSKIKYGIAPAVLPQFLSYCLYVFEINIRAAAIIGLVGAGGIGTWLNINFDLGQYNKISSLLLTLFLIVATIDFISSKIRKRLTDS
tara:strand:- start:2924 stop:3676 length:753 start_codon:yes stop_codon:yes gene_type:complete